MKSLFADMYELFRSFYGTDLADHLFGLNPITGVGYESRSLYLTVGFWLLFLSFMFVLGFYKFLDSPRYSHVKHWAGFLLLNIVVNFIIGFYLPYKDYEKGNIAPAIKANITTSDIINFGIANAFWATIWFLLFSMFIRQFSTNARLAPFGSKWIL